MKTLLEEHAEIVEHILDYLRRKEPRTEAQIGMVIQEQFGEVARSKAIINRLETKGFVVRQISNGGFNEYFLGTKAEETFKKGGFMNFIKSENKHEPHTINAPNSNIHIGNNSGTYHQESDNSNNKNTNRKTIKNSIIAIFIATVAGLLVWYLTTQL